MPSQQGSGSSFFCKIFSNSTPLPPPSFQPQCPILYGQTPHPSKPKWPWRFWEAPRFFFALVVLLEPLSSNDI